MKKFISTGGVGDAFIAALKIKEWRKTTNEKDFDWLHVESENIEGMFRDIIWIFQWNILDPFEFDSVTFLHSPDYISCFKSGEWSDRESIPISFNRECNLHKAKWEIQDPFMFGESNHRALEPIYDLAIQVSAGQKQNKQWLFNIVQLAQNLVRNFDYKIVLIGNDPKFLELHPIGKIEPGLDTEVCQWNNLNNAAFTIHKAKAFIGLSGFMNYYACAYNIPNIHLIEGKDQELDYYHKKWEPLTYGIKHPSLAEVMRGVNHFRREGIL